MLMISVNFRYILLNFIKIPEVFKLYQLIIDYGGGIGIMSFLTGLNQEFKIKNSTFDQNLGCK